MTPSSFRRALALMLIASFVVSISYAPHSYAEEEDEEVTASVGSETDSSTPLSATVSGDGGEDEGALSEEESETQGGEVQDSRASESTLSDSESTEESSESSTSTSEETEKVEDSAVASSSSESAAIADEDDTSATSSLPLTENASSTLATSTGASTSPITGTTSVTGMVDATPGSTSTTSSTTVSSTSTGDTTIESGRAIALANILNIVNTNFVNSDGVVVFKNFFEVLMEDFDLRDIYASLASYGCSFVSCATDGVRTNIDSSAVIDNELYVEAVTGGNTIEGADDGVIRTGDAYAGVNLVNVANTNVIDSNYLLLTMNAFEGVDGDIVFPSLAQFFQGLGGSSGDIDIHNDAAVDTNLSLTASTGGNSTEAGSSTISTGNGNASGNIFNSINTSLIGGQSVSIVFRVHGSWAGEIFGAPPGLAWMEDGEGGIYLFDQGLTDGTGNSSASVSATNTAAIRNNVEVVALTGENAITGANTALISTGNAHAGANIMNIANATVVGRNWILAIVNIFGDFNGNIAFGRPDLWVGGQADVPATLENGSTVTYTATVLNNGDSPASRVRLHSDYDERYMDITSASIPYTAENGTLVFSLADLPPGAATEISYTGVVRNAANSTEIESILSIESKEKDNALTDNTDIVTIVTDAKSRGNGVKISLEEYGQDDWSQSGLSDSTLRDSIEVARITKETNATRLKESKQKFTVYNSKGSTLADVIVYDTLTDSNGVVVHQEVWELGDVLPKEEIEITYGLTFGADAPRGTYTLTTTVTSRDESADFRNNGTVLLGGTLDELLAYVPYVSPLSLAPLQYESHGNARSDEGATSTMGEVRGISSYVIPTAEASGGITGSEPTGGEYIPPLLFGLLLMTMLAVYTSYVQHARVTRLTSRG